MNVGDIVTGAYLAGMTGVFVVWLPLKLQKARRIEQLERDYDDVVRMISE